MDEKKFDLILDKLLEKTEAEKLAWKTTADKDTFLVALKDSSISLSQNIDHITDYIKPKFFTFDFRNENGEIAESVNVTQDFDEESRGENFNKAERIYDIVRSQTLKIDQTVDRIIEQLAA